MFNNNLKQNHAQHEKCNTAIKQTSMASAASKEIIGGGAPTIKNRRPTFIVGHNITTIYYESI